MKTLGIVLCSIVMIALLLSGCGASEPDYTTKQFETALKKGENVEGKTVAVTVRKMIPDSAFGYNIQAGEHLNFVSSDNPNVKKGDKVTLKAKELKSVLGSFLISYEKE
ncbi:hypothetical protein QUF84_14750 [Fictibacillus enclensis]|uniref:hypothetical protein n=1 Tax=Fictibacillus enclensis TaxID=1017270 RepID=UPI0025A0BBAB|nr:hypothetical protein [Fictibacillus enclensis]MDM5338473.1 hypothetical protein [Fictibacillus enclensis]